jgi:hypothetical protein
MTDATVGTNKQPLTTELQSTGSVHATQAPMMRASIVDVLGIQKRTSALEISHENDMTGSSTK